MRHRSRRLLGTSRRALAILAASFASVASCASERKPAATTQEDMVAVSRMLVTLDRLAAEADLEGLLEYVSEDAVFMLPDKASLIGIGQIRTWYRALYADYIVEMSHEPLETDVFGNVIVHRGNLRGTFQPKRGAASVKFDDKYLFVILKQPDGSLKIWRAIFNSNPTDSG